MTGRDTSVALIRVVRALHLPGIEESPVPAWEPVLPPPALVPPVRAVPAVPADPLLVPLFPFPLVPSAAPVPPVPPAPSDPLEAFFPPSFAVPAEPCPDEAVDGWSPCAVAVAAEPVLALSVPFSQAVRDRAARESAVAAKRRVRVRRRAVRTDMGIPPVV
ncbi:hypothetical protein GCM10010524_41160 [Streptomyces mexicanus]